MTGDAQDLAKSATPAASMAEEEASTLFAGKGLFWIPVLPLFVLDLWSKAAVFAFLKAESGGRFIAGATHDVFEVALCKFQFVNWHNTGTVWGLFQNYNQPLRFVRLIAILVILWFVYKTPRRAKFTLTALGLILSGALGNLYDNFIHHAEGEGNAGAVRDFLFFSDWFGQGWNFPAFNVADSCITVGAVTLFIILWGADQPPAAAKA